MNKWWVLLLGCMSLVQSLQGQYLEGYLQSLRVSHPAVKASQQRYLAAKELSYQKEKLPDPQLGIGVFAVPVETRLGPQVARLTLSQMLPWFGTLRTASELAAYGAFKWETQIDQQINDLALAFRKLYYQLYQVQQDQAKTQQSLQYLHTYETLARSKFEAGMTEMVDVVRVQMSISEVEARLERLEDREVALVAEMNAMLNRRADEEIVVPASLAGVSRDYTAYRDSLALNPSFEMLEKQHRELAVMSRANQLEGAPKLGVGVSYIATGRRTDANPEGNGRDAAMASVSISLPLNRKALAARDRELLLRQQALHLDEESLQRSLEAEYARVLADIQDAERRMLLYTSQLQRGQQARELLLTTYSVAGKDFNEVLQMEMKILDFELSLDQAQADHLIQHAKMLHLIGKAAPEL